MVKKVVWINLVIYSVLFIFGHFRRKDQCAVYISYFKISTDPGLPKIRRSRRFFAVVLQILIPFDSGKVHKYYEILSWVSVDEILDLVCDVLNFT